MLSAGIVGLPNVGKSTLFNALTRTHKAPAENYPFCTIDPNVGVVTVPDARLVKLAEISHSHKIVPTAIEFVDIAGLVKGASAGEGLGNQFLHHIREVDAIVQVVRCFENSDVHHVSATIDPIRDIEVINTELVLADLASLQRQQDRLQKQVRAGNKAAKIENALAEKLLPHLDAGKPAITAKMKRRNTCAAWVLKIAASMHSSGRFIICLVCARFSPREKKRRAPGRFTRVTRRPRPRELSIPISSAVLSRRKQSIMTISPRSVLWPKLAKRASCGWKVKIT